MAVKLNREGADSTPVRLKMSERLSSAFPCHLSFETWHLKNTRCLTEIRANVIPLTDIQWSIAVITITLSLKFQVVIPWAVREYGAAAGAAVPGRRSRRAGRVDPR